MNYSNKVHPTIPQHVIATMMTIIIKAAGRLKILIAIKILILVNVEINRKKQTMYINYQPQHMSFRSSEKQSYLKWSVQLRSGLQLLQVQPVV